MKKTEYSQECFNTIKELKEIVMGFAEMSGLALSFVDLTDQSQWVSSTPSMSNFCRMVRETPSGLEKCKEDDYENSKMIVSSKNERIYKCHAGLWEFGIPIVFRHKTIAAICGGQFRPPNFKKATLKEFTSKLSLDEDELLNAFNGLKKLTKKELERITSSLDHLAKKIVRSAERQRVIEEAVQFKWLLESSDWTPKEVLKQIKDRCRELVGGVDHGCILQRDPNSGKIRNVAPCQYGGVNCIGEKAGCEGIKLAIENKEAILVPDARKDPRYNTETGTEGMRANIVAPIMRYEEVIGVINLHSLSPNALDESDKELIQLLTPLAGVAIRSAEQIDTLKSLYDVVLSLSSAHDLPNVLIEIVQHLKRIINADVVVLYPYDKEIENFAYKPFKDGVISNEKQMILYGKCERIVKSISQRKEPYFADNVKGDKELDNKFARTEGIKSSAGVPLIFERDIMGALFVNFRKSHHFTEEDQRLIKIFGSLSAVAINRCQLQERMVRSERLDAMGNIYAKLAHWLGNPLCEIDTTIENLLGEKGNIKKKQLDKKLNNILECSRQIVEIQKRILKPLRPFKELRNVNINSEINNAIAHLKGQGFLNDNINMLSLSLDEDLPELQLDPIEIREVFLNLLHNSINAMPDGGDLKIVSCFSLEDQIIQIIIEDTGCGIPDNIIESVFEPFETATVDGTGLGLSISYEIVKGYGGSINITSEVGKGSKFIVTLPLNEVTAGNEALGCAERFFKELLCLQTETEKVKEIKEDYDDALSKARNAIESAIKDIEERINDDFVTAREIFYSKGTDIRIYRGKMIIGENYVVNDNFELVDEIQNKLPGANVTIFQIIGEQAVRISTNVLNTDNARAINTVASKPVYKKVIEDNIPFTGRANVVGEWRITRYEPICNINRDIIGMLYIGIPERHPQIIEGLNKEISSIRFGNGGFIFILDNKWEVITCSSHLECPELQNYNFCKEIMQRGNGWTEVSFQSGTRKIQEIIHYHRYLAWDWTICAAYSKNEVIKLLRVEAKK